MSKLVVWSTAGLIGLQRLLELRLARRNQADVMAMGAQEFSPGHYPLFFMLHTSWLIGWLVEANRRGSSLSPRWSVWLCLFLLAQGLRYWAIVSLGPFWNTRIVVLPGTDRIRRGPYRFLAHPNYLAVAAELAAVPLLFRAPITALVVSLLNAALLLGIRIPAEEQALRRGLTHTQSGAVYE
jgi:methyltransferase